MRPTTSFCSTAALARSGASSTSYATPRMGLRQHLSAASYVRVQDRAQVVLRAAAGAPSSDDGASSGDTTDPTKPKKGAYAIPTVLKNPGAWFILAGVLRVVQHLDPLSMLSSIGFMAKWPWFFMGPMAIFTVAPVAIGIGILANFIVKKGWMENRWFAAGLWVTCGLALWGFQVDAEARVARELNAARMRPTTEMVRKVEQERARDAQRTALGSMLAARAEGVPEVAAGRSTAAPSAAAPAPAATVTDSKTQK